MSLGQNDRDKWINLSALHEKEIYDLQGKVADLVRLQLETLEERNKAEAENERLRKAGDAFIGTYLFASVKGLVSQETAAQVIQDWQSAKEGRDAK